MSICDRLRLIREQTKESQAKFASRFEMAQNTYGQYEIGKRAIPDDFKNLLAKKLNINLTWLITGEGDMYLNENLSDLAVRQSSEENNILDPVAIQRDVPKCDPDVYLVPITNLQLSAGNGALWPSDGIYLDKVLPVPKRLARKFGDLLAAVVWGDSMAPTLNSGEPVAYIKNSTFDFDGLYVISWHGDLLIKRLARMGNSMQIISDNPKYPTKEINLQEDTDFTILGKVVFWMHIEEK